MVKDHLSEKIDGDKIIEIFIEKDGVAIWIPVMATQLYTTDNNGDINKISEIRVRDLSLERKYGELSNEVDSLTRWLKDHSQEDVRYKELWDRRVDIKAEMRNLLEKINSYYVLLLES